MSPASSSGLMSLKVWAMPLSSLIHASSSASPRLWVAQGMSEFGKEVAERDLPGDRRQVVWGGTAVLARASVARASVMPLT